MESINKVKIFIGKFCHYKLSASHLGGKVFFSTNFTKWFLDFIISVYIVSCGWIEKLNLKGGANQQTNDTRKEGQRGFKRSKSKTVICNKCVYVCCCCIALRAQFIWKLVANLIKQKLHLPTLVTRRLEVIFLRLKHKIHQNTHNSTAALQNVRSQDQEILISRDLR